MTQVQRWREKRDSYRPAGEVIRTNQYEVAELQSDNVAREFVERHHYSGSYPAARVRIGLYRQGELAGVAVFSHPANNAVLTNTFPSIELLQGVELGRFVLLDEVPANGETWMLARSFDILRQRGIRGVVSFSDPIARADATGRAVFPGHVGTIYQAHNGRFLGRGSARTLALLPDATVFSHRSEQKIRSGERGVRYAAGQLEAHGAEPLPEGADRETRIAWLERWKPRLTRPLRHPGNFRYAWPLDRGVELRAGSAYPKLQEAA